MASASSQWSFSIFNCFWNITGCGDSKTKTMLKKQNAPLTLLVSKLLGFCGHLIAYFSVTTPYAKLCLFFVFFVGWSNFTLLLATMLDSYDELFECWCSQFFIHAKLLWIFPVHHWLHRGAMSLSPPIEKVSNKWCILFFGLPAWVFTL